MKKPFNETKFGQFLGKAKDVVFANGGDVVDIAFTAATQGPAAAIKKTVEALKGDNSKVAKELLSELELRAAEFEKDMYALEIQDRDSARTREVEIVRTGKTDWMMIATGATGLLSFIGVILAIIFIPAMQENDLFIHLIGMVEGVVIGNIFAYYFGTSKGSKDKQAAIDRMTR